MLAIAEPVIEANYCGIQKWKALYEPPDDIMLKSVAFVEGAGPHADAAVSAHPGKEGSALLGIEIPFKHPRVA